MFFLITGASGVGKSTVRKLIEPEFANILEAAELASLGVTPKWTVAWRQEMVERMMQRVIDAQRRGKHFLFCGDPVPPGEVCAVPSAKQLEGVHVCLLDASTEVQTARLAARGDDPQFLQQHVAFADWMRRHVNDPRYRPDVIIQDSWPGMRWERWVGRPPRLKPWSAHVVDTTNLDAFQVGNQVGQWLRDRMAQHNQTQHSQPDDRDSV